MGKSSLPFNQTSRFSRFPRDLQKIIVLFGILTIYTLSLGFFNIIFAVIGFGFLIITISLYRLNTWGRKAATLLLGIAAVFFLISTFLSYIVELGFYLIPAGLLIMTLYRLTGRKKAVRFLLIGMVIIISLFQGNFAIAVIRFLFPIFTLYLFYWISNDKIKLYFDYPEMIEIINSVPERDKEERPKDYKSFHSYLK